MVLCDRAPFAADEPRNVGESKCIGRLNKLGELSAVTHRMLAAQLGSVRPTAAGRCAQASKVVEGLAVTTDKGAAAEQIKALYNVFAKSDCTMVEARPAPSGPLVRGAGGDSLRRPS